MLGVRIRRRSRREALDQIRKLLAGEGSHSVYFVHAGTANLAFESPRLRAAVNRGDLVLNDGIGVRLGARAGGVDLDENLVGTDLVPQLFLEPFERPLRVYLLGGRPGVAERAADRLRDRYPGIEVVGAAHGYFAPAEENDVVERTNRAAPDLLLVGMGSPTQELFIDRNLPRLRCRVAMGVGGLFDHFAGDLERAAPWMRRCGLEWTQLLIQQPRKWRRYLLGNPKFLWRVFGGMLRRRVRGATVAGLSVTLALLAGEGIVRIARPQILDRYPEGLYVASATRQYKLRPHFRGVFDYPEFRTEVRISGQGLREDRTFGSPRPGVRRILALGDSFTMGYSVAEEHTWVRVLETMLGSNSEVINAGVPGYSTRQEMIYLEEEGLGLEPDVVVMGFFVGNDVSDNARPALPVELRGGRLLRANAEADLLPVAFRLALARNSHLYQLTWPLQRALRGRQDTTGQARFAIYAGEDEAGWVATRELVEKLASLSESRGFRLIVVLIPERIQVESRLRRRGFPWDPAVPNRRMRAICGDVGVESVDLLDAMAGGEGLYFPQDGHWTRRGNAAAARAVADHLSR